jgi:hypothetical protein
MRKMRALWLRFCAIFATQRIGNDFDAELEGNLNEQIAEGVRSGLSEMEARRQALLRIGGVDQVRQAYRDRARFPGPRAFCAICVMRCAGLGVVRSSR